MNEEIKCPECGSDEIELEWQLSFGAYPEWKRGDCEACGHTWNECGREG